jgi:hypothetical protein
MNAQGIERSIADTPRKRSLRLVGAIAAVAWPFISYSFNKEPWIVPITIVVYVLIIRFTRSGYVLPYAVRGLAAAFVISFTFMLPTLDPPGSVFDMMWALGFWVIGIWLGVILGIAADVGNRPDNPFRQSDEEKELARRSLQGPD